MTRVTLWWRLLGSLVVSVLVGGALTSEAEHPEPGHSYRTPPDLHPGYSEEIETPGATHCITSQSDNERVYFIPTERTSDLTAFVAAAPSLKKISMTPEGCPAIGKLGHWGPWSLATCECDKTRERHAPCERDPASTIRSRTVICAGHHQTEVCPHCPVHGGWSIGDVWTAWTPVLGEAPYCPPCSKGRRCKPCAGPPEIGEQRYRTCTNPTPAHGGNGCPAPQPSETRMHGGWSAWGPWGSCVTEGYQRRHRTCTNPAPDPGAKDCSGLSYDGQMCWLAGGYHTYAQCSVAGGTPDATGNVCRMSGTTCPSRWSQLENWSTTSASTHVGGSGDNCSGYDPRTSCTTGEHPFSNKATEPGCSWVHRGRGRSGNCKDRDWRTTAPATVTEIGCY
jgi:hypothetical protein